MLQDSLGYAISGQEVEERLGKVAFEGLGWMGEGVAMALRAAEAELEWRAAREAERKAREDEGENLRAWRAFAATAVSSSGSQ